MERGGGYDPPSSAWKAEVIPLYEPRIVLASEGGFEPPTYRLITYCSLIIHLNPSIISYTNDMPLEFLRNTVSLNKWPYLLSEVPLSYSDLSIWCRLQAMILPPPPYKGGALPNELNRHQENFSTKSVLSQSLAVHLL